LRRLSPAVTRRCGTGARGPQISRLFGYAARWSPGHMAQARARTSGT